MEANFQGTISNVSIKPGAEAEFKIKAPATQLSEVIKMAELGQLNLTLKITPDQQGKKVIKCCIQ